MAVTRLERKARRNKTRAKVRTLTIKRHASRIFVKSPYKEESGVILEEGDVFKSVEEHNASNAKPAAKKETKAKAEAVVADAPVEVETPAVEAEEAATEEKAPVKKAAAKKPAVKKPAAKKPAAKKSSSKE